MMNLLNVIIPMPYDNSSGGNVESMLLAWWCFLLVFFILIVNPCVVYIYWYFKKGKGRFSSFRLSSIPVLASAIIGTFTLLVAVIGLLQITFFLYDVIC